ncbi:MAG: acyl-CoA dehydrogenase [Bacteriovoracaceae bacterium]|jgi:alkylation response protein AidB-like acyl-CoA dehydrogenase|nr:hypothetical protein [Halobacteriovoraceae bacterium]MDP7319454.1 acyl-CoA dehydrogenase [Bacteriovoracaceae bacterium]
MKIEIAKFEKLLKRRSEFIDVIYEDDEQSQFPSEMSYYFQQNILSYFIPSEFKGRFEHPYQTFCLGRVLARRNLTSAIAIGQSFLGSIPVWLAGTQEQKEALAKILSNSGANCLALTEEKHGSDLSATEVFYDQEKEVLSGTKWCINNATKGKALTVLAMTKQGPTLFFVKKDDISDKFFSYINKIKTHGIRGADISGIIFSDLPLKEEAFVGRQARGLEIVAKTMHVSRTLCASFSLGAADTTFRNTLDFVNRRVLYGKNLIDDKRILCLLSESFARIMACEALSCVVSRVGTVQPEFLSLYSAVIKAYIPPLIDQQIKICSEIMGARYYLRENDYPLFQKFLRDHAVVSLFDGSVGVNLSIIASKFNNIKHHITSEEIYDQSILNVNEKLPEFDFKRLKLSARNKDFLFSSFLRTSNKQNKGVQKIEKYRLKFLESLDGLDHKDDYQNRKLALDYCRLVSAVSYYLFLKNNKVYGQLSQESSLEYILSIIFEEKNSYHYSASFFKNFLSHKMISHFDIEVNE